MTLDTTQLNQLEHKQCDNYIEKAFSESIFIQKENEGAKHIKRLRDDLLDSKYSSKDNPIQKLVQLALEEGMRPYLKRTGKNTTNPEYKTGDMIGLYFSSSPEVVDSTLQITPGSKFCGVDVSKGTVNLQLFGTNANPAAIVSDLARNYDLTLIDGSLRVSISDRRLNKIIDTFVKYLEGRRL